MQGISNMISSLTNGATTIDSFWLPDNILARRLDSIDERRVVRANGDAYFVVLHQPGDPTYIKILPDGIDDVPLLVLGLDEGPQGTAFAGFAWGHSLMILFKWDIIHRLIRDVKLSLKHAAGSCFLKAQVFSAHVWGLNMKPYGTKTVRVLKRQILNVFLSQESVKTPVFQKYGNRIADQLGLPYVTCEDQQVVFDNLVDMCHCNEVEDVPIGSGWSFAHAGDFPKLASWFSWNTSAHSQMKEYWAAKMLFEYHLGDKAIDTDDHSSLSDYILGSVATENPQEQLRKLKMSTGGLPLAHSVMTSELLQLATILYVVTLALWDWYTDVTKNLKTPDDSFKHAIQMSLRGLRLPHLREMIRRSLYVISNINFMGIPRGVSTLGDSLVKLVLHLLMHQCWSFAARQCPPECYGTVFSISNASTAMEDMKARWETWCSPSNFL